MITEKEKASAPTLAGNNKQRNGIYHKPAPIASLKIQIGEILLLLLAGNEQQEGWQRFEQLLRQFYDRGVL